MNILSSTVKKACFIFYQGYPCTNKNWYLNGDWLCNCKYNRGKTACAAKLYKKLDGTHVKPGVQADICLMKIVQVTVVKTGVLVLDISEEMKIMVDDIALKNLFTTPSSKCFLIF